MSSEISIPLQTGPALSRTQHSLSHNTIRTDDETSVFLHAQDNQKAGLLVADSSGDQKQSARNVRQGIHWRNPTVMISLFLISTGVAVGHHFYYRSLEGQEVVSVQTKWTLDAVPNSQGWKIRCGLIFTFAVKVMYTASAVITYKEFVWVTTKKKAMSFASLHAMFPATSDIFSFFSLEYVSKAKRAIILAIITW